jgi:hypothetical protein
VNDDEKLTREVHADRDEALFALSSWVVAG